MCIGVDELFWLAYVLTLASVTSHLHVDPPYGSGWQYLTRGRKQWFVFDKAFFHGIHLCTHSRRISASILPLLIDDINR
jgi:hypothetical protein